MKRVYYGKTASGKTRECINLAKQFSESEDELIVVSNIPAVSEKGAMIIDPVKRQKVFDYSHILERLYNGEIIEDYTAFKFTEYGLSVIKEYIEYLMYCGDVLILDDIDCQLPYLVLDLIIQYLSENEEINGWKHVIVTGYSPYLRNLLGSLDDKVYFAEKNNNIVEIEGNDNIDEKCFETVYV